MFENLDDPLIDTEFFQADDEFKRNSCESKEEDDGESLMSNMNCGLEQDNCYEQHRDINNLDVLEMRATNHVHAIDGRCKSMLKDIHQHRTIYARWLDRREVRFKVCGYNYLNAEIQNPTRKTN